MKRSFGFPTRPKAIAAATTAVAIAVATVAMMGPGSANASVAEGHVSGVGVVTNDWNDEGTLSRNQHAHSNAVGLWQWVLYADGAIEQDGTKFDKRDIDCQFGPNTEAATKSWQRKHGFTGNDVDGIVGKKTFGKAGKQLGLWEDEDVVVIYYGSHDSFFMDRTGGKYEIDNARMVYEGHSEAFCSN